MDMKLEKGQQITDEVFFALMNSGHKRSRNPLYAPKAETMALARDYSFFCDILSTHVKIAITLQTKCVIKKNPIAAEAQIFAIENEYRYFSKRLNYSLFKKGSRRAPELNTLLMLPTMEGRGFLPEDEKTLHYHIAVGKLPLGLEFIKFRNLVREIWRQTKYGSNNVQVAPADDEWTTYITKELMRGNIDCIDWPNASIPYKALNIGSQ